MIESTLSTPYHTYICRSDDTTRHHVYQYLSTLKISITKFNKIISKLQLTEWRVIIPMLYSIRELLISGESIEFNTTIKLDDEKLKRVKSKIGVIIN